MVANDQGHQPERINKRRLIVTLLALPGYQEYAQRVRYKLMPGVW